MILEWYDGLILEDIGIDTLIFKRTKQRLDVEGYSFVYFSNLLDYELLSTAKEQR